MNDVAKKAAKDAADAANADWALGARTKLVQRLTASVGGPSTDTIKESLLIVGASGDTGKPLVQGVLEWVFASDLTGKLDDEKAAILTTATKRAQLRGKIKGFEQILRNPGSLGGRREEYTEEKAQCEADPDLQEHKSGPAWNMEYNDFLRGEKSTVPKLQKQMMAGHELGELDDYTF